MSYMTKISSELALQNRTWAFVGVHVVPMDSEQILKDQTVIVTDGIITDIGDVSDVKIPENYFIINGNGKYLMPGLSNMHVHISSEKDLLLFVAHGVTTVQNMWGFTGLVKLFGFPDQLDLRNRINKGELFGPTIYTAGIVLDGKPRTQPFMYEVKTGSETENAVLDQKERGYDFIKVYDNLTDRVYDVIMSTAKQQGMPVKGHAPKAVGLDKVLGSGQVSIEHLTGYIDPDAAEFVIPVDMIDEYAKRTRESGVWNCPTVVVWQKVVSGEKVEELKKHPGMRYFSGMQKFFLKKSIQAMNEHVTYEGEDYNGRMLEIYFKMIGALNDAGANLLLGTDAGNPFVFPGYSIHEELTYMVDAGLTPYEAILAGTRGAAESLNKQDEFGTVAKGKCADLILVDDNQLQSVANITMRSGVMLRGMWFPEAKLREMLEELAN